MDTSCSPFLHFPLHVFVRLLVSLPSRIEGVYQNRRELDLGLLKTKGEHPGGNREMFGSRYR